MPADLAVVGLGHLGLPLAQAAVAARIETIGYDPGSRHPAEPAAGITAAEIRRMLTAVVCAPTPPGPDGTPDLTALADAARALASRLRPHTTVILESAVQPGT